MPQQTPVTLNHFALVRAKDAYWALEPAARQRALRSWLQSLRAASEALHVYQAYGFEARHDLIIWSARRAGDPGVAAAFFSAWASANAPVRQLLEVSEALWGFTRPSQYTKARSAQELDPFAPERLAYLVVYPFVKTTEWYLKDRDERQRMMAGHIKVGKQYGDITQLLLYSYGLQDQEFVVVYETADLLRFLSLVQELRGTEARRFTQRDAPLHAGLFQPTEESLAAWL
ncbi:MAG TPA: chlorite dismutase family protein [Gemmatimonadales bacterium]|nr:chlorite dismutase family protein [Gemmatimonadales bacterium]